MILFCNKLPKIELHAHLNGSLSASTLQKLGCDKKNIAEYQKLNKILEKTTRTLDECFKLFNVAHNATSNVNSLYKATTCVIDEFYKDNCVYLELRTTPRSENEMSKCDYIKTIIHAIKNNKNDIIVKLILSIDRRHAFDLSNESLDLIIENHIKYPNIVVGVDLCGNPNEGVFYIELFKRAKAAGLFVTLHCGEVRNDLDVFDMIKLEPDRLGHGTFIHPMNGGSMDCWELYTKKAIPLECCLTSNVICGTVKSYENHHIKEWIKNKFPFSIATDDKGVFCTTLSNEYLLAATHFNLSKAELWQISYNTIAQTFATEEVKEQLKSKLLQFKTDNM